jgi:transposase
LYTHRIKDNGFLPFYFSTFPTEKSNVIKVEAPKQCILCPLCSGQTIRHQWNSRLIRHSYSWHEGVIWLEINIVRQRCKSCDLTFTYDFNLGLQRATTSFFRKNIVKRCHERPLTQVSKEYEVPYSTLERWYYEMISSELKKLPETAQHICIDEFALRKGHHYAMAALDAETGHVLHLEQGRDQVAVESLLKVVGHKAETIISDLAPVMAKAMEEVIPSASHVLDRFHLIQFCTEALKRRRKYLYVAKAEYKARFIDRCLAVTPESLPSDELQLVREWLEEDWVVKLLYQLLQHVRYVLKSFHPRQAKRRFKELIERFSMHQCGAAAKIIKTFRLRYEAFLNTIVSPFSNGIMEGTNNKIKLIKRRGYGYRNEQNLFLRIRLENA